MVIYQRFGRVLIDMVDQAVQIEEERAVTTKSEIGIIRRSKSSQEIISLDKELK